MLVGELGVQQCNRGSPSQWRKEKQEAASMLVAAWECFIVAGQKQVVHCSSFAALVIVRVHPACGVH